MPQGFDLTGPKVADRHRLEVISTHQDMDNRGRVLSEGSGVWIVVPKERGEKDGEFQVRYILNLKEGEKCRQSNQLLREKVFIPARIGDDGSRGGRWEVDRVVYCSQSVSDWGGLGVSVATKHTSPGLRLSELHLAEFLLPGVKIGIHFEHVGTLQGQADGGIFVGAKLHFVALLQGLREELIAVHEVQVVQNFLKVEKDLLGLLATLDARDGNVGSFELEIGDTSLEMQLGIDGIGGGVGDAFVVGWQQVEFLFGDGNASRISIDFLFWRTS